jgi:hypothetical protein
MREADCREEGFLRTMANFLRKLLPDYMAEYKPINVVHAICYTDGDSVCGKVETLQY